MRARAILQPDMSGDFRKRDNLARKLPIHISLHELYRNVLDRIEKRADFTYE